MDAGLSLSGGNLQHLPAGVTLEQVSAMLNEIIDNINGQLQTSVQADQTAKRYVSGYQKGGWPGGDFGLKVSPAGVDVTTCAFDNLLYAQDFTTGIQYYNVGGARLLSIGSDPSGSVGLELLNGSNAQLFIGRDANGNIVVKIAQDGYDARTATEDQLVFDSSRSTLQLVAQSTVVFGSGSVGNGTISTDSASFSYPAQSQIPLILTQIQGGPSWEGLRPYNFVVGSGSGVVMSVTDVYTQSVGLNTTTLTRQTYNGSSSPFTKPSLVVDYYVLNQPVF